MTEQDAFDHGRAFALAAEAMTETAKKLPHDPFSRQSANEAMALMFTISNGYFRLSREINRRNRDAAEKSDD